MAYTQLWGTPSPGHIVYLVDLSGSMEDKVDYTIDTLNKVFYTLTVLCAKGNDVKERLTCSVIGYNDKAWVIWDDMSIRDIAQKVVNARQNKTPIFDKEKEFMPKGQTWMRLAFDEARKDIHKWIAKQKAANKIMPAPIVINITDGYPFEGGSTSWEKVSEATLKAARDLMSISTPDGNVRVFNIHHDPTVSASMSLFPSIPPTDPAEKFLFDASSEMDSITLSNAKLNFGASEGSRYMVSNVKDSSILVKLVEWGSTKGDQKDGRYF